MSNQHQFDGRVALITGSSSGIGAEIAIHMSGLGARVVLTGRSETKLKQVTQKCFERSPKGHKPLVIIADLEFEKEIKRLVSEVLEYYGRIDILVNNAGILRYTDMSDPDVMAIYDNIMKVNVRTAVLMTKLCAPSLEETKGNIVNVSSVNGLRPAQGAFAYCMSKSALDMFTKCMAGELGPKGIRVNSVNPAAVDTPLFEGAGLSNIQVKSLLSRFGDIYPIGRVGEVHDIAKVVAFLASDDACFVTGVTLPADGGTMVQYSKAKACLVDDHPHKCECTKHRNSLY